MTAWDAANRVIGILREQGYQSLLAGGCVRDLLLGCDPKDYDVATKAPPDTVCKLFHRTRQVGARFGVVLVRLGGQEIEVATFRTDGDYRDGRRPMTVQFTDAEQDARRRDFSINGMFYDPVDERLVDYVGGADDLKLRLVRCIGDPEARFAEDHLRMLRAVRFASRLGFDIEDATMNAIIAQAEKLQHISAERIRMELEMILTDPSRARGWRLIGESKLLNYLAPGARWSDTQATRTETVLSALPEMVSLPVAMAALYTHASPSDAAGMCEQLRCSNELRDTVRMLLYWVDRILDEASLELADIKALLATNRFDEVCTLARAVIWADKRDAGVLDDLVEQASAIPQEAVSPPPLITGDDLLDLNLKPGPDFSRILDAAYRAQRNEQIDNREQALEMVRSLIRR